MRTVILVPVCAAVVGLAAFVGSSRPDAGPVKVRLRLIDARTGKDISGIIRAYADGKDQPIALAGALDRMRGLAKSESMHGWHVVPDKGVVVELPRAKLRIDALRGLETALTRQEIDLREKAPEEITLKLDYLFDPDKEGLAAGNTHLHLMKLSREDADDYLRQIPAADGLKVLFLSHLERKGDDKTYITNGYPTGDLPQFNNTGVLFNNGEEHRHNFTPYGQGYGHIMFLNIKQLVRPVSLGAGITGEGNDDRPMRPGIEDARKQGGTVIWCHNNSGYEGVPSALAGRLDAHNVFDGSRGGRYEDNYYRFLNIGLRMPISTGTDWFLYDFSRVYAKVKGELSIASWLDALRSGRNVATNGPLLRLTLNGKGIGEVLTLNEPTTLKIEAEGIGRQMFGKLQLVQNGRVVQEVEAKKDGNGWSARLGREMRIAEPAWFAVRIESQGRNELGQVLFAHSSPVYVEFAGARTFDLDAAEALQKKLEEAKTEIAAKGRFSGDTEKTKLLAVYDEAIEDLRGRINRRGKP